MKTKSKYLTITLSCIVFIMNIPVLNAHGVLLISSNFISQLFPQPIHLGFNQNYDFKNQVGISKVNIKFKESFNNNSKKNINLDCFDIINFGIGYKYYKYKNYESYPFFDFNIVKLNGYYENKFSSNVNFVFIDHETKVEMIKNYQWIQFGFNYGYNFLNSNNKMYLVPMLHFSLGLNTYKIDTLTFRNIDQSNLSTQYTIADYGLLLYFQYKRFSIEADYNKHLNFGDINRTSAVIKATYRVTENIAKKTMYRGSKNEITFVSFDLLYRNENFEFAKNDISSFFIETANQESLNLCLTFNLNWIIGSPPLGCANGIE